MVLQWRPYCIEINANRFNAKENRKQRKINISLINNERRFGIGERSTDTQLISNEIYLHPSTLALALNHTPTQNPTAISIDIFTVGSTDSLLLKLLSNQRFTRFIV